MKNGSKKHKAKSTTKKGTGNNAAEKKETKTNTGLSEIAKGNKRTEIKKQPLKEYTRDQLKKQGYTPLQANIIKEGFRVSKTNKVAVNDLKTGKLTWINANDFEKHISEFTEIQISKQEQKKKQISELLGTDLKTTSTNVLENITNSQQLKEYLKKNNLRDAKGRFIKKSEQKKYIKFFKAHEHEELENFNLNEVIKYGKITKHTTLKTIAKTPKDFFYWNLQNNVKENDFGTPEIKIIDFDGNVLYEGKSSAIATAILNKLNKKLDNLETVTEQLENTRPYFTIPVKEEKIKGIHTAIEIDYSQVKSRLKGDLHNKYRSML